jgi:hypothetical protein
VFIFKESSVTIAAPILIAPELLQRRSVLRRMEKSVCVHQGITMWQLPHVSHVSEQVLLIDISEVVNELACGRTYMIKYVVINIQEDLLTYWRSWSWNSETHWYSIVCHWTRNLLEKLPKYGRNKELIISGIILVVRVFNQMLTELDLSPLTSVTSPTLNCWIAAVYVTGYSRTCGGIFVPVVFETTVESG